jgi:protein-disulfide isomerase
MYAEELELDLPRFARELQLGTNREAVRRDFLRGVRSGVNGTPSFFINGVRYDGSWELPPLVAALKSAATE